MKSIKVIKNVINTSHSKCYEKKFRDDNPKYFCLIWVII